MFHPYTPALLSADDPAAAVVERPQAASPFLLLCDHAGHALNARQANGQPCAVIAMHSFTPVFKGAARPWQVGLLFNRHSRFALLLAELLREEGDLQVGVNEPYAMIDVTDYTLPVHAERHALPYVGIEIRQDLIGDATGQTAWAERLARLLPSLWQRWEI